MQYFCMYEYFLRERVMKIFASRRSLSHSLGTNILLYGREIPHIVRYLNQKIEINSTNNSESSLRKIFAIVFSYFGYFLDQFVLQSSGKDMMKNICMIDLIHCTQHDFIYYSLIRFYADLIRYFV